MRVSRSLKFLPLVLAVFSVLVLFLPYFIVPVHAAEPPLTDIFTYFGFTNVTETTVETFPAGTYNITLYAEFAGYSDQNELSYYKVNTSVYNVIFAGPEGGSDYIEPPVNKSFTADYQFGLSMISPGPHRYYTETSRNGDGKQHAKVYRNLGDPAMFLIGFENQWGGGDEDYNDMVFSLKPYAPTVEYYLTVETEPAGIETIPGEGWYDDCTYVDLTASDFVPVSGVRYRFDYWDVDDTSKGTGVNPITVQMDANHTATAHYVAQYYLTVVSPYDDPGGEGWYDNCTYANATLATDIVDHENGTRRVFTHWSGDASGTNYAKSEPIHMNENKTAIANWKTQYYLTLATSPPSVTTPSGEGWYDAVTYAPTSTPEFVPGGSRYRFTGWTTSNMSEITDPASPSTTVLMDGPKTVTANYVIQYLVTFTQTGLSADATGTVLTVNGSAKTFDLLPFYMWVDTGSVLTYSYEATVSSTISGKQYRLDSVTGPTSPITVTADTTVTGNYVTQYQVTFAQTGLDATATGTVMTVNGDTKAFSDLPYTTWIDIGDSISYSYSDTVSSSISGKRFSLVDINGPDSPISVTGPVTVTGNYKTQYEVTFDQSGVGADFTGTVVTIDGTEYGVNDLSVSFWWDFHSTHTFAFQSPLAVTPNAKQYVWNYTSGLSSLQSDSINVSMSGNVIGNYKTQYYLTVDTDPAEVLTLDPNAVSGEGWHYSGSTAVVNAVQNVDKVSGSSRYDFRSWTGATPDLTKPSPNPATVLMDGPKTATANYVLQYRLTLTTSPSSVTTPSGEGWYDSGTNAAISTDEFVDITPGSSRYRFDGWTTGDMGEIANPGLASTTVLMDKAKTVTANYVIQYKLTVRTSGLGTQVTNVYNYTTVLGTATDATPYTDWFDEGSSLQLNIDSPITDGSARSEFTSWSGDATGSGRPVSVTMNSAKDITANYKTQYKITFDQTGVSSDFTGTVVTIDGTDYNVGSLSVWFWWNEGSIHSFDFKSPLVVTPNDKRYVWTSTSGLSSSQSGSITVSMSGSIIGNYKIQFYLTVTSPYDTPTPTSGWFDAGTPITASVTSPWAGPTGVRYVCTGWTGTGSVSASGSAATVTFTINAPSSITWNWKTQYYLTVKTDPTGLSPPPTPSSGWYDESTDVVVTAKSVSGYTFNYWDVNGVSKGPGVNPITVHMDDPHKATAHYQGEGPTPVGGHAVPIGKSHLLALPMGFASRIGLALTFLAAMAVMIILIRRRNKIL